jgi:hypothetical protein
MLIQKDLLILFSGKEIATRKAKNRGGITAMANPGTSNIVDEYRAAALLGLALPDLRWFSRMLGLGHKEESGNSIQTVFTYEELKRLSSEASASAK